MPTPNFTINWKVWRRIFKTYSKIRVADWRSCKGREQGHSWKCFSSKRRRFARVWEESRRSGEKTLIRGNQSRISSWNCAIRTSGNGFKDENSNSDNLYKILAQAFLL